VKGNGVGVDHNVEAVAICRRRGLRAFTPDEFATSEWAGAQRFDSLLFAHVLEHLEPHAATALVARYLPELRPGGQVIAITPQERGQASDNTHVAFVDFDAAAEILSQAGLIVTRQRSFPLPRRFGRRFIYNEFVTVARRPGVPGG
jgi:trans-aconitate methyltransferase